MTIPLTKALKAANVLHYVPDNRVAAPLFVTDAEIGGVIDRTWTRFNAGTLSCMSNPTAAKCRLVSMFDARDGPQLKAARYRASEPYTFL